MSCNEISDAVGSYLQHLATYFDHGEQGTEDRDHLDGMIRKLLDHPPIVVRETDNLVTIHQNLTHFFRILGPVDIVTAKEMLSDERQNLEQSMALFYTWSEMQSSCPPSARALALPLEKLYEYAGFFMNTLGGKAYLFRRDPDLRLLVQYYAVLILDQAETASMNRYGIDIRKPLASLIKEMRNADYLTNKEHYLETLYVLENKYLAKYGQQNDMDGD